MTKYIEMEYTRPALNQEYLQNALKFTNYEN